LCDGDLATLPTIHSQTYPQILWIVRKDYGALSNWGAKLK